MARSLAALLALVVSLAFVPDATAAPHHSARTAADVYNAAAFAATNHQRATHDRVKLKHGSCLQRYAQKQADRMAKQQRMFHQSLEPIQTACKVGYVGENVAYGYPNGRAVVTAWMHSEGHRANILFKPYRLMGLAAAKGGGRWYVSQVFGRHL